MISVDLPCLILPMSFAAPWLNTSITRPFQSLHQKRPHLRRFIIFKRFNSATAMQGPGKSHPWLQQWQFGQSRAPLPVSQGTSLNIQYLNGQDSEILARFLHHVAQAKHGAQGVGDFVVRALLQVILGDALHQVAPAHESRAGKALKSRTVWVGKELCVTPLQRLAQSWDTSELGQAAQGLVLHPTRSTDPLLLLPPPHQGPVPPEAPCVEEASMLFALPQVSPRQLWVHCSACSPSPRFSTDPPPSLLFAAPASSPSPPAASTTPPSRLPSTSNALSTVSIWDKSPTVHPTAPTLSLFFFFFCHLPQKG